MKKLIFISVTIIAMLTSCCDNVYINGKLDGMWQLQKIENRNDGTVEYPQDIYYSFQRNLTFIAKMNETDIAVRYLGNLYYDKEEKTVTIDGFREFTDEKKLATQEILKRFMIFETETTFIIDNLENELLVMSSDAYTYFFRKW